MDKIFFIPMKTTVPYITYEPCAQSLLFCCKRSINKRSWVIWKKPSFPMSLWKVIGEEIQRVDGYMEGNGYLVSWCMGHLVELSQPEAYDEKYAKWRYDDLPILPKHWQVSGIYPHEKAVWNPEKAHAAERCGESDLCNRRAGREGRTDFPTGFTISCGCKAGGTPLDFLNGGQCDPRRFFQKLRPGTEYECLI